MKFLIDIGILLGAYVFGSIPFGLIVVKLMSGKDIRTVASGRTGGTNAMRAAGPWAGVLTAVLDIVKAAMPVWIAQKVTTNVWILALAPVAAILGHNYSIFLAERGPEGHFRLRGGAGGAAAGGGAFGLWPPIGLILIPVCFMIWYGIGYASITTLSVGVLSILIFGVRAALGLGPWEYVIYGVLAEALMVWALRPNIKRLIDGTERRHGLPVILQQRKEAKAARNVQGKIGGQADGPTRKVGTTKGPKAVSRTAKTRRNEFT
jgi:acyl phosphate:glycerol-3-phosphate acyltransferase